MTYLFMVLAFIGAAIEFFADNWILWVSCGLVGALLPILLDYKHRSR